MPLFELRLSATLEGVASVRPGADYQLRVRFACGKCRTLFTHTSVFSASDEVEGSGGGSAVHCSQRCKECSSVGTAVILPLRPPCTGALTAADAEARKPAVVALLECRGLVPMEAEPGPGWVVAGPSMQWEDVNLDEEWCEYDEGGEGTSLTVLEAKLEAHAAR